MPSIDIKTPHSRKTEDVIERIEDYLLKMRDEKLKSLGFQFKWDRTGERRRVDFKGRGFEGFLAFNDLEVSIHVELNLLLAPLKAKVEESMRRHLDQSLNPPAGA